MRQTNEHLGTRRKRHNVGAIVQPSAHMDQLAPARAVPQQGQGFSAPKPISPERNIRSYKRRGIGGRKHGGK